MRILITGTAGFIGFSLARRLLEKGHEVAGVDGFTTYYDPGLKRDRHAILKAFPAFAEHEVRLEDAAAIEALSAAFAPEIIVHLAAQAGVRYSLENPRAYVDSNLIGTFNIMEAARVHAVKHFLLASTSSAYGATATSPFQETEKADYPLTLYAASKKATELMSHSYSHLWGIPTTAFRFFTVYGPWGRPDMALFKFVEAILKDEPIDIYNHGEMARDFTYVDDLVAAIEALIGRPPVLGEPVGAHDSLSPVAPWRLVNIGAGRPVKLMDFVGEIERALGRKAQRNYLPMQPGDAPTTFADNQLLQDLIGPQQFTPIAAGVQAFVDWRRARGDLAG